MELLFVVMIAAAIGIVPRYLLPGRERYGSALLPALSAAMAAIVWAALTWVGWTFDGGWIWWVSFAAGAIASLVAALILAPRRVRSDTALFDRLLRP